MSTYYEIVAMAMESEPYNGALLRHQKDDATAICQTCGPLPPTFSFGWTSDWTTLAHQAMDHAKDTGHNVAVSLAHYAWYGPDPEES